MNLSKKILSSLLMMVSLLTSMIQGSDVRDEQGRTELMNYVIEREATLVEMHKLLDLIAEKRLDDAIDLLFKQKRTIDDVRKSSDSLLYIHYQREAIRNYVLETCEQLQDMVDDEAELEEKDCEGKKVLDFCKTRKIYCTLRELGAPFQFNKWASVYQNYLIASGVSTVAAAACFYSMQDGDKILSVYRGLSWMDTFKFAMAITLVQFASNVLEGACAEEDTEQ